MTARPAPALPEDGQGGRDISFEPKLDGWRCVAFHRANGRVALQSRRRKRLTVYFPEIATAVGERVPAGSVLDGELVAYCGCRCDFVALQRRITDRLSVASPVTFVVFDLQARPARRPGRRRGLAHEHRVPVRAHRDRATGRAGVHLVRQLR